MKQSTLQNCPSDEIITKLITSVSADDRLLGIEFLLKLHDFNNLRVLEIRQWLANDQTVVLRDTSERQRELVIGKYGAILRKITNTCALGVKIFYV